MDTGHEGGILGKRRWQRNIFLLELRSGISEVELIEDTVTPVVCQGTPVLLAESLALSKEPTQVRALRQFIAVQRLIDTIAAHFIVLFANRYHIDTFPRFETDLPIVLWYTGDDMVVGKVPARSDITVFNPHIFILLRKRNLHNRILYEDRRMGFAVDMHNLTLVIDEVLQSQS